MPDRSEYHKQYYKDNREKCLNASIEWAKNNPEKIREAQKRWRQKHKKEINEYDRRYYQKNRRKIIEQQAQYQENHYHIYRRIAEEKIGRKLKNGEIVHHIDMNGTNNNSENLYVYKNGSKHSRGHWSLNKLIASLLKDNIIKFEEGVYKRR